MKKLTKSREDYLEAILKVREEKGHCMAADISSQLGFSKPIMFVVAKKLKEMDILSAPSMKSV